MKCSLILMVVYATFLFWRIFVNYSIKILGDYLTLILGSLTYSGFVLTLYITKQYYILIMGALVWGWGAAALWITSSTQVLDASKKSRYGTASGIFYCATHLGFAVGIALLGRIGHKFNGDNAILTAFIVIVIGNFILLFVPKNKVERNFDVQIAFSMMMDTRVKIVGFFLFVSSFGFGLMLGAFSNVAKEHGFAYLASAAVFAPLARAILSLLGGAISDKLGRGKTLFLSFLISFLGLASAGIRSNITTLGFGAFSLGVLGGLVPVSAMAIIGDSVPTEKRHLAFSATFVWRDLGVVISLFLGQYLSMVFGEVRTTFISFACIFLICSVLSFVLIRYEHKAEDLSM